MQKPGEKSAGSFSCHHNGLIKISLFREQPRNFAAPARQQQVGDFRSADGPVFTYKLMDAQCVLIIKDVLDQPVMVILPVPGLEADPMTVGGLMNTRSESNVLSKPPFQNCRKQRLRK